ncbi:MAG TPA: hypothetical protein VIZ65_08460 [Cellvibrionaceae bacterium]
MDSISINHAQTLSNTINTKRIDNDTSLEESLTFAPAESNVEASAEVVISPLAFVLSDLNLKSRFTSADEFSEHTTKLFSQFLTTEEIQSGARRPFASAEDARLSRLSLRELMEESNKLPLVDENGHSRASFYRNEQTDRISIAAGNLLLTNQVNHRDAAFRVDQSVSSFKLDVEEKVGISSTGYDIVFKDGKATAIARISSTGVAASPEELKNVQEFLDNPSHNPISKKLLLDIDSYNRESWQLIDNELTIHIYGGEQDRYLQKQVSKEWLMEGTNYSTVSQENGLYSRYVEIVAAANIKYQAALEDGSHYYNNNTDPGILEITRIRESLSVKA